MKMIYVGNIRLPTEKAHGYQIMKMCEAFASCGADVELWHPARLQANKGLRGTDAFAQYGVRRSFTLRKIRNIDVVALNHFISDAFFMPFFFLHALMWGWYAAGRARKAAADVYYARDDEVAYWLMRRGMPTVYEEHGIPRGWKYWMLRSIARSSHLRLVVAVTGFLKDDLVRIGFPAEKIIVLPDAVDMRDFPANADKLSLRGELGLPADKKIAMYMGNFTTKGMAKGVETVMRAVSLLDASCMVVLVGGQPDELAAYGKHIERSGLRERVVLVPFKPHREAMRYLAASDALLMPFPTHNRHYRLHMSPLKMFEYMASGTPIVASDLPAVREILNEDNSFLCETDMPASIAGGVAAVFRDPALAAARAARARSLASLYSWESRARVIINALE